jgi:hypothetical protein
VVTRAQWPAGWRRVQGAQVRGRRWRPLGASRRGVVLGRERANGRVWQVCGTERELVAQGDVLERGVHAGRGRCPRAGDQVTLA